MIERPCFTPGCPHTTEGVYCKGCWSRHKIKPVKQVGLKLYVAIGLPCSGKSAFYEELLKDVEGLAHVSADIEGGETQRRVSWWQAVHVLTKRIGEGSDVYFDATNITKRSRGRILDLAKREGVEAVAVWFRTPFKLCMKRNAERKGQRRVPDMRMAHMRADLEPPTKAEGFEVIIRIGPGDD